MAARNHEQWLNTPELPAGDLVDSRVYSDPELYEEEQEKIFKKVWHPVCHESELPKPYDFRTHTISREPIIITRGPDDKIRAFLNVCSHRGMMIERRPAGSFMEGQPSGNPKRMTCMFHAWQYDMKGNCVYISREKEGYQDRVCKEQMGLRRLRCEVKFGGFVWVSLNDKVESLEDFCGDAFEEQIKRTEVEPLEVFHYHKAILPTNYKLWHDTNSELYHDYLHYHNRITGFDEDYFKRKGYGHKGGHITFSNYAPHYSEYDGFADRDDASFPNTPPNGWYLVDLFPGHNFNLRGSAFRVDIQTPIGPDKVMIEFRGLGLKSDTPEVRQARIDHHNSIWGPFGRNLHEDLLAVSVQGSVMLPNSEPRRVVQARHEDHLVHDEIGLRHFYDEWGRMMDRDPGNPDRSFSKRGSIEEAAE